MLKKIALGYAKVFRTLVKALIVLAASFALTFSVVYPLWRFALSSPKTYTVTVLSLFCAALVGTIFFRLQKRIKNAADNIEEKKHIVRTVYKTAAKIMVATGGLFFFFFFILRGTPAAAAASVVIAVILYGIFAFGTDTTQKERTEQNDQNGRAQ